MRTLALISLLALTVHCGGSSGGPGGGTTSGTGTATSTGTGTGGATTTGSGGATTTGSGGTGGTGGTSTGGAGGGSGGGALVPSLGAGPFGITYAAEELGIDIRPSVTATFASTGGLESYVVPANTMESPTRGTTTLVDLGGDGVATWGRWSGGTLGGTFYASTPTFAANEGFHHVIGQPATSVPSSGAVIYVLAGWTKPTIKGGALTPGTTTGTATIAFGASSKVALSFDVTMPGDTTYHLETSGGLGDPSTSELSIAAGFTGFGGMLHPATTGLACSGGAQCNAYVEGLLFGAGATRLGVSFSISTGDGGAGVHGVALLQK